MKLFQLLAPLAALGASISAQAATLRLESSGLFYVDPFWTRNAIDSETVTGQIGGFGSLASLDMFFHFVNQGDVKPYAGSGAFVGEGGTLAFDLEFTTFDPPIDGFDSTTFVGVWTLTGGTGSYANVGGSGTIVTATNFINTMSWETRTSFEGEIAAVPEPASLVTVLGLGLAAFVRRSGKEA